MFTIRETFVISPLEIIKVSIKHSVEVFQSQTKYIIYKQEETDELSCHLKVIFGNEITYFGLRRFLHIQKNHSFLRIYQQTLS